VSALPETAVPRGVAHRILASVVGQARRTPRCPDSPRLDGALAIVTGATGGIGFEIARGLARRGAELVLPCRSPARGDALLEQLRSDVGAGPTHRCVELDLEDLDSARACAEAIERVAGGRGVDVLVENAGIWPQRYARTRQGHEIAFGVNLLAHFALRRALQQRGLLPAARVVMVTGDIYVLESACTPDYVWRGPRGGMRAYCRSKLGILWLAGELQRRFPALTVHCAHPGVVDTNLGGRAGALGQRVRRWLMLDAEQGAQMPLWCATQPGLAKGGYYHNTQGHVRLPAGDPALDPAAAARLWGLCEALTQSGPASAPSRIP
jgi:NAD(P)-dependent dehydrogenase (short-subunit alcohol dehydrogenase family)